MRPQMIAAALLTCCLLARASHAEAQRAPVPLLGRQTEVTLLDGSKRNGELIATTGSGMLLDIAARLDLTPFAQVDRVRVRQHGFGGGSALTWLVVGAMVSGLGMAAACSQVEGTSCGAVFPAVALSFGVIGGLFTLGITSSEWREIPADDEALRAYARFPQGAPPGFEPAR